MELLQPNTVSEIFVTRMEVTVGRGNEREYR